MARDIDGLWNIIQSNGFVVPIHVDPIAPDGAFTLEAQQGNGGVSGTGAGNVTDDFVNFVINWTNDTKGAYNGSFDEQGFIHGSTFDLRPSTFDLRPSTFDLRHPAPRPLCRLAQLEGVLI